MEPLRQILCAWPILPRDGSRMTRPRALRLINLAGLEHSIVVKHHCTALLEVRWSIATAGGECTIRDLLSLKKTQAIVSQQPADQSGL